MSTKVDEKIEKPKRPKTGGRTKGTPNKRSEAFGSVLDEKGFSIPEKAIELYESTTDAALKLKLLEFMSSYSRPKIKDQEFVTETSETESDMSDAELLALVKV